jgi:hypothetical protein
MTSYDRALIQDVLLRIEQGVKQVVESVYELENFVEYTSDDLKAHVEVINRVAGMIQEELIQEANKLDGEID